MTAPTFIFPSFICCFLNKSKLSGFSPLWLSLRGSASTELFPRAYFSMELPALGEDQEHCAVGQPSQNHPSNHPPHAPTSPKLTFVAPLNQGPFPSTGCWEKVLLPKTHVFGVELAKVLTLASCRVLVLLSGGAIPSASIFSCSNDALLPVSR